jgi:hypothetical protein
MHQLLNEHFPGAVMRCEKANDHALLSTQNGVMLRVEAITDHVLRFRYTAKGYFEKDFSYALDGKHRSGFNAFEQGETASHYLLKTPVLEARISKEDAKISLFDAAGNLLNEDEKGFHWEENPQHATTS